MKGGGITPRSGWKVPSISCDVQVHHNQGWEGIEDGLLLRRDSACPVHWIEWTSGIMWAQYLFADHTFWTPKNTTRPLFLLAHALLCSFRWFTHFTSLSDSILACRCHLQTTISWLTITRQNTQKKHHHRHRRYRITIYLFCDVDYIWAFCSITMATCANYAVHLNRLPNLIMYSHCLNILKTNLQYLKPYLQYPFWILSTHTYCGSGTFKSGCSVSMILNNFLH